MKSNPKASADFNVSFEQILPAGITSRVSNISASKSTGSKLAPIGRPHNSFNRSIGFALPSTPYNFGFKQSNPFKSIKSPPNALAISACVNSGIIGR